MNILNRLIGLNKPPPGATLNWGHPLAPIHPRACVLPLNEPTETIRDAANGRTFTRAVTFAGDAANNWTASGLPVSNGLAFRSSISSNTAFTKFTAPNAVNELGITSNPFCTAAVIFLKLSNLTDGPRPIGNGENRSVILEPGFSTTGNAYVLNGNVAHVDTGLPWTTGNWGFFGASVSSQSGGANVLRAVVNDYKSNTIRTANTTLGSTIQSTSNTGSLICLGGIGTNTGTQTGTDGLIYWAMIDYAEWSVDRLIALSQNPFGMFEDGAQRAYFILSSGLSWSVSDSASGSDSAAAASAWGVSDAGSGAESGSSASAWSAADAGSAADAAAVAWAWAASDSGSASESIGFGSLISWAVSDSGSASDAASSAATWGVSDSAAGSDAATRAAALAVSDSASGVETLSGSGFTLVVLVTTLTATTIAPLPGRPDPAWTTVTAPASTDPAWTTVTPL